MTGWHCQLPFAQLDFSGCHGRKMTTGSEIRGMMSEIHPDSDLNLANAQGEDSRRARGKLKIFLGYAAGVGKTYAMLEAALQRVGEGVDVVAAYVETHGRSETEEMVAKLESVSSVMTHHRGIALREMALDEVLVRRPALALVDDLAHTNVSGSRHSKRYQDVLELLNAGIDVYTTLNVQHLESLNDVVAQITGIVIHETVPDRVLDEADEIELVDLPIDELQKRLAEGKVTVPGKVARTAGGFFRPGNLTALRELAFRCAADRVDEQMRAYMESHGISGPWPATERVLVCVGPSPLSGRLVRTARRLAARLNAEWRAIYVETPAHARLSEAERDRITRTLHLAEELGAKSVTVPGNSVAETVAGYARTHNVTKIVAGKPLQGRWTEWLTGSVVDQLIHHSHDIDVYVISGTPAPPARPQKVTSLEQPLPWTQHILSAALVGAATLLGLPLRPYIEPTNLVMFYLLAVIVAAIRLGRAPAILASLLSVVAFDLVFVPPYYTFVVTDAEYLLTFAALLGVGVVISTLATRARRQARAAQRRQAHTAVLYELSRDLAAATGLNQVAQKIVAHVEQTLSSRAAVLAHDGEGLLLSGASNGYTLDSKEHTAANWSFQHGATAGRSTETLSGVKGLYLPLKTANGVVGVLGVRLEDPQREFAAEQRRLLESFASQAAVAVERSLLAEKAREAQLLQETEKLQAALLNSISHDLRTPLASITGALSSLREAGHLLDEQARRELVTNAYEEAERLNRLVGNLLNMTRLESGALRISAEPQDVEDVIGVALSQIEHRLQQRMVHIDVPESLALVPMDLVLVAQVLVNLLENAHKYSPPTSPLEVRVRTSPEELLVEVMDRGPGIPEEELDTIFDKFYRLEGLNDVGGTGLGLSISKGIVEAHGGCIWAQNREGGGSVFTVALPLQAAGESRAEPTT